MTFFSNEVWLKCAQRLDLQYYLVSQRNSGASYKALITFQLRQINNENKKATSKVGEKEKQRNWW